jgi:hypothetical protein
MNFRKLGLGITRTLLAAPLAFCALGTVMNYSGIADSANDLIEGNASRTAQALYNKSWQTPLSDPASSALFKQAQSIQPDYSNPVYVISTIGAAFEKLPNSIVEFNKPDIDAYNKVSLLFCIVAGGVAWFAVILSGILFWTTFDAPNQITYSADK